MNFESLLGHINQVQDTLQAQAAHAVNLSLTARNWLVGYYIVEFEQKGEDRAKYGENLLKSIAKRLNKRGLGERRLYEFRLIYSTYPQIGAPIIDYISRKQHGNILRLPTAKSVEEPWQTPCRGRGDRFSAKCLMVSKNYCIFAVFRIESQ